MDKNNKLIPDDLIRLEDFAEKYNLPLSRTSFWRISQNPSFPPGYIVGPRTKLYSESRLAGWFDGCRETLQKRRG